MNREENCGCGGHGQHHGDQNSEQQGDHGEGCGCGKHEHHGHQEHGMNREKGHGECSCGCHQHQEGMGFHRRFVSREDVVNRLEEYLKQLQAEAKGVEERIAELKKG
jgi:hypothetical protein